MFGSKFREGYWERQIPEEDRSVQRQKCYSHKNQEECTRSSFWGVSKPPARTTVKCHKPKRQCLDGVLINKVLQIFLHWWKYYKWKNTWIQWTQISPEGFSKHWSFSRMAHFVDYSHVDNFGTENYQIGDLRERDQWLKQCYNIYNILYLLI